MPCKGQKVELVSHPRDWKTIFRGIKLTCDLDNFDVKADEVIHSIQPILAFKQAKPLSEATSI